MLDEVLKNECHIETSSAFDINIIKSTGAKNIEKIIHDHKL